MAETTDIIQLALNFLKAIENNVPADKLREFYDDEIEQIEFPNQITKQLTKRGIAELMEANERGRQVLTKQTFEVTKSHVIGNTVILEAIWTGILAIPVGSVPAGGEMTAYFAQFFEFRNGKIMRQRNYDCFEWIM